MFGPEGVPGDPGLPALIEGTTSDADLMLRRFQAGFGWLTEPRRVTVAAVRGHAIGAGFQLALACDLRLAAEDAQFTMAETTLGLVPDLGGTLPLVRAVGYSRAAEICLTGRRVPAAEALRIGLVNDVVPVDELDHAVDELVGRLRKPPAGATQETLALLAFAADGPTLDRQRAAERAAQLRCLSDLHKAFGV
jgi:enoyl-CoA hydratase/carnithine racemase